MNTSAGRSSWYIYVPVSTHKNQKNDVGYNNFQKLNSFQNQYTFSFKDL